MTSDFSKIRGAASLHDLEMLALACGGKRITINEPHVKCADFIFDRSKVILEIKNIEKDLLNMDLVIQRLASIANSISVRNLEVDHVLYRRAVFEILQKPLKRLVSKANAQIKHTKTFLKKQDHEGVILISNNGLRSVNPQDIIQIISHTLAGGNFSNTSAFIYVTNHYLESPDFQDAKMIWYPLYSPNASSGLREFINNLGRKWREIGELTYGPFESSEEMESLDLTDFTPVTGPIRQRKMKPTAR